MNATCLHQRRIQLNVIQLTAMKLMPTVGTTFR